MNAVLEVPPPAREACFAIEARGVTAAYAGATRLKGVDVTFPRNRVSAILGPSGCGKSTLLRTLNRTLELVPGAHVQAGAVLFDGLDIYGPGVSASWVRTHVGMVQQKPTPFQMSILDNVLFGARYHGLQRDPVEHAREYLERVGLWTEVKDRLKSSALSLSGGQQQRLCMARTLAVRPSVVLMDEPCSALDPRSTSVIEGLVKELAADYTIVIVTHNIAQALRVAHEAVFMVDGEVIDTGSRDEVLGDPRHPVVRDFVTGVVG
ncbi:phosphate ABC transporter ATP-binding protein [Tepidicella baoligensis]|uniref:phosphate ABC transporter ATP-binding protein n=1 Tax=Tepidicella baoligensis TaxID=2707016 RepID=UPI0015DBC8CB|nr:phosphate ABC transporter ATP-binding protein [Tepidicella baoligensis]